MIYSVYLMIGLTLLLIYLLGMMKCCEIHIRNDSRYPESIRGKIKYTFLPYVLWLKQTGGLTALRCKEPNNRN